MKSSRFIAVLVAVATVAIMAADANAMYHVKMGRFLQRDPIGVQDRIGVVQFRSTGTPFLPRDFRPVMQYRQGENTMEYVGSGPLSNQDPYGLEMYTDPRGFACCKTKIRNMYAMAMDLYAVPTTSCTQNTIVKTPLGATAMGACKCHYRNAPHVTVYDAHDGKCCWCSVKICWNTIGHPLMDGTSLRQFSHGTLVVDCPSKGKSWEFDANPMPDVGEWFGGYGKELGHAKYSTDPVTYPNYFGKTCRELGQVSCSVAADAYEKLDGEKGGFYSTLLWNCHDIAENRAWKELFSKCP